MQERFLSGLDAVEAITQLLQRTRIADHTAGIYEAAELQFWWGRPRRTDDLDQLFWFDDEGPVAAFYLVDFGDGSSLVYTEVTVCAFLLPSATPDQVAQVFDRGLAHAAALGFGAIDLEVGHDDEVLRTVLADRGFVVKEPEVLVECRMDPDARAEISPLADGYGYRLVSRSDVEHLPHHMSRGADDEIARRLGQLSLYRPELDLVVLDGDDEPAGHGMCWYDPSTGMGLVEPMRTHDAHQQRGLARHILTAGLERLVGAGATTLAIGYEPDNPASGHLYRSVGFEPVDGSDLFSGPTSAGRV